jgi:hypothetical protein
MKWILIIVGGLIGVTTIALLVGMVLAARASRVPFCRDPPAA